MLLALGPLAGSASASHGRYFHVTWTETGPNSADFTVKGAFRRDGYTCVGGPCTAPDGGPGVGDVINEGIGGTFFAFGDGASTGTLNFRVLAINPAENWLLGQALEPGSTTDVLLSHTYASAGPFTAFLETCCTIFELNNNPSGTYRAATLVDFGAEDESAQSSVPPIVNVGNTGVQTWPVPAIDSGGETLTWRLATAAEACGGCSDPQPPGLAINSSTGVVTWDTTGVIPGLWFTSVIIESHTGGPTGPIVSTTQVQYLINVSSIVNAAPDWVSPPTPPQGQEFTVNVGSNLSFSLQAQDPDTGDTVHIDNLGLPAGATFTSTDGNPANASFSWTPAPGQEGDYLVTFTAQDDKFPPGSAVARTYVIHVVNAPPPDTTRPECRLLGAGTDASGKKYIEVYTRDTGSGLATIVVTKSNNALTVVPAFTPGTTDPVIVRGTKINNAQGSQVELRVTDVAGNVTNCDPEIVHMKIGRKGLPAKYTARGLPRAEHKVLVTNESRGLRRLTLLVNGQRFQLKNLRSAREYRLNIRRAMKPGNRNTVTLIAHGRPGASALVIISD